MAPLAHTGRERAHSPIHVQVLDGEVVVYIDDQPLPRARHYQARS